ncbi:MAG: MFS transporter [Anaerolineales bacterium]
MASSNSRLPSGLFGFSIVWLGQIVSVLATSMTQFALSLWVLQKTNNEATPFALMQVFFITPFLLISPIAGVMVDRYNRKLMMMVSDLCAGLATVVILILQSFGMLEIWHLYVSAVIAGLGNAFQWPAYSAAISTMMPKEQYGRANGLMSLVEMGPNIVAPLLAGALLPLITLTGILWFDVATFLFAIGVLLVVHVPQPQRTETGQAAQSGGWLQEAAFGFRYIFSRPSLLGLQLTFFFGNLFSGIAFTLVAPMIVARVSATMSAAFAGDATAEAARVLGLAQSAGAIGGVLGGIAMSAWGGFKRRVHGVLLGWMWSGVIGLTLLGLGRDLWVWLPAMFLGALPFAIVNGSNQAIYQAKVPPDVQGRVFSARRLIAWFTQPLSPLIAGLLADRLLEPSARAGTGLVAAFSGLVGTGPGAGMALLLIVCGVLATLVGAAGYFIPVIRNAEDILPDYDAAPVTVTAAAD